MKRVKNAAKKIKVLFIHIWIYQHQLKFQINWQIKMQHNYGTEWDIEKNKTPTTNEVNLIITTYFCFNKINNNNIYIFIFQNWIQMCSVKAEPT
jgi:hypothetical protein